MPKKPNVFSHILYAQGKVSKKKRAKIKARINRLYEAGVPRQRQALNTINELLTVAKEASKPLRKIRYNLQVLERMLDPSQAGIVRYYLEELRMLEAENQGFIQDFEGSFSELGAQLAV